MNICFIATDTGTQSWTQLKCWETEESVEGRMFAHSEQFSTVAYTFALTVHSKSCSAIRSTKLNR